LGRAVDKSNGARLPLAALVSSRGICDRILDVPMGLPLEMGERGERGAREVVESSGDTFKVDRVRHSYARKSESEVEVRVKRVTGT